MSVCHMTHGFTLLCEILIMKCTSRNTHDHSVLDEMCGVHLGKLLGINYYNYNTAGETSAVMQNLNIPYITYQLVLGLITT